MPIEFQIVRTECVIQPDWEELHAGTVACKNNKI